MKHLSKLIVIAVVALGLSTFLSPASASAWRTDQSASTKCRDDQAVIKWSFSNTEPTNSPYDYTMTVKATDLQTGKHQTVVVDPGQTKTGEIKTGRDELDANKIKFYLTWTDGRHGDDYRYASYHAVDDCAPRCQYNEDLLATDPNCKQKCQFNAHIYADDPNCKEICQYNDDIFADDANCQPECQYDDDLLANDPNCKEICQYNDDIFADNEKCQPVCEHDDDLLAGDPNCKEKCQYNDDIYADDPNCQEPKEVCKYNQSLTADDPNCKEKCQYNDKLFADDADCKKPEITVVEPTVLPRTGVGSIAALFVGVSTSAGAAHSIYRKLRA